MYTNAVLGEGKCALFREVSLIQGSFLERFHCITRCQWPSVHEYYYEVTL